MTPILRALLFVSSIIVGGGASANSQKACLCEVGQYPEYQQPAFSTGCALWLREQKNCLIKKKVSHGASYTQLPQDITQLSIGYVGHWNNSRQLLTYLHMKISPLMTQKNLSVSIDNTACSSMNEPTLILDYVKDMALERDQTLTIKGNQTRSIGKWDAALGSKNNFYAVVSSKKTSVTYPNCRDYQNYSCLQGVQTNDEATCVTDNAQQRRLRCCQVQDSPYDNEIKMNYAWLPLSECY